MKPEWTDLEFPDWTFLPSEMALLANKTGPTRLGFAVLADFISSQHKLCSVAVCVCRSKSAPPSVKNLQ
jgi:hypothetical protein